MESFKNNAFVFEFVAASDFFKAMEDDDDTDSLVAHQKQGSSQHENSSQPQYTIEMISTKAIIENERKNQNKNTVNKKSIPRKENQFAPYQPTQKNANQFASYRRYPVVEKVSREKKPIIFGGVTISKKVKSESQ